MSVGRKQGFQTYRLVINKEREKKILQNLKTRRKANILSKVEKILQIRIRSNIIFIYNSSSSSVIFMYSIAVQGFKSVKL